MLARCVATVDAALGRGVRPDAVRPGVPGCADPGLDHVEVGIE